MYFLRRSASGYDRAAMSAETLDAPRLLEMSSAELDGLFKSAAPGQIPQERGKGTVIIAPGTAVAKPAAKALGAVFWHGKRFHPSSHDLHNEISPFGVQAIRAQVYTGDSWFDERPCIVLDYSKTSQVAGWIRDEIREVGPGLYLGLVWGVGKLFGGRKRVLKFALSFPAPGAR